MDKIRGWCVLAVVACVGCGDSNMSGGGGGDTPTDQATAVRQASETNCNTYQECGSIGPDKTYVSYDDCMTRRLAFWNERWPASACTQRISQSPLSQCLNALGTLSCNSLIDELKVNNEYCPQANICAGP
ncbi:DUF6184 family natural product biosynthesis lipoprotein [Archangium primigenium]|uniref:DUF6184 family natural product biosynthesis lipoprotein n=1 Tax=[Archangium] primigenium TaxID=2792470 RepID=UPI00195EF145|nr:DUF6184 family natural product biosynthesis lipoprotein [Archangium primigenium]MBM7112447.1 hypothetical protein [Archangium primigenium]